MMEVLKSEVVGMEGVDGGGEGKEGRRRKKRLVDTLHGNWAPLAFPGRFCRWSRDEPTPVESSNCT